MPSVDFHLDAWQKGYCLDSAGKKQISGTANLRRKIIRDGNEDIYNENLCLQYCAAHLGSTACEYHKSSSIKCLAHTKDVASVSDDSKSTSLCYRFNEGKTF